MSVEPKSAGGATVALLNRMPEWQALLVLNLRLWSAGPEHQADVWDSYAKTLPRDEAHDAMRAFDQFVGLVTRHSSRPMICHGLSCNCVSLDEAIFARMTQMAVEGQAQDALLMAALVVPPGYAEAVANLAGLVGRTTRQMAAKPTMTPTYVTQNRSAWLH